jgi:hypothetical protein
MTSDRLHPTCTVPSASSSHSITRSSTSAPWPQLQRGETHIRQVSSTSPSSTKFLRRDVQKPEAVQSLRTLAGTKLPRNSNEPRTAPSRSCNGIRPDKQLQIKGHKYLNKNSVQWIPSYANTIICHHIVLLQLLYKWQHQSRELWIPSYTGHPCSWQQTWHVIQDTQMHLCNMSSSQ